MTARPGGEIRVVIDSSVILPILIQREPETNPLLQLWQEYHIKPLVDDETLAELRRLLLEKSPTARPLQAQRFVASALRRYLPWCEHLPLPEVSSTPKCRDPEDQKFIDLAVAGGATLLLTRDNDLLSMGPFDFLEIKGDRDFLRSLRA